MTSDDFRDAAFEILIAVRDREPIDVELAERFAMACLLADLGGLHPLYYFGAPPEFQGGRLIELADTVIHELA